MQKYLIFLTLFFLSSCSDKNDDYDKAKAISAFAIVNSLHADPALEKVTITLPKQEENKLWYGSSSEQNSRVENIAFNFSNKKPFKKTDRIWSGFNFRFDDRFVFSPIITDKNIFLFDGSGILEALDLKSRKRVWKTRIFPVQFLSNYQTPRIGYASGKIFAIAGINKISAINEIDGKIIWSKDIASVPISTPISDGKLVYVSTNDNKLYAFNAEDGELQWIHSGIIRPTAIFGAASPVIYKDLILASYSSGEIYAINKKTGEPMWSQDLNISKATNSDFYLNDIDATPLVKNDVVYAIGNGGLMMAIDAKKGNYLWKKEIAGVVDFWAANGFLFVINNDNKLIALSQKNGGIKWVLQLPNFVKEKKPETKILYSGVTMVGDKLLISSVRGEILIISPLEGKIEKTVKLGSKIFHSPIVVNEKIYLHAMGRYIIELIEIK